MVSKRWGGVLVAATFLGLVGLFQNCSKPQFAGETSQSSLTAETVVCANLSGDPNADCVEKGFEGNLYIQPRSTLVPGQHGGMTLPVGSTFVDDYIRPDWRAPVHVQLSELNVPARNFSEGFADASGKLLTIAKAAGGAEPLIEWFALDLVANFHLATSDADGSYQFAIVADDGARVAFGTTGSKTWQDFIDDQQPLNVPNGNYLPGTQSPRMGCAATFGGNDIRVFPLKRGAALPLRVRYYQGPRLGLALTLLYRQVPASGPADVGCGKTLAFTPGQADYDSLGNRGWKVVSSAQLGK